MKLEDRDRGGKEREGGVCGGGKQRLSETPHRQQVGGQPRREIFFEKVGSMEKRRLWSESDVKW